MTGEDFDALPAAEKERIFRELDNLTPEQVKAARPLTAKEKREHFRRAARNRGGRPKLGKAGTRIISVSVEKSLLKDADAFAKSHGLNRSELVSSALRSVIVKNA